MKEMAKEEVKKDYNTVNQKIAERLKRFNAEADKERPRTGEKKEKKVNNEEGD